ncbi:DUF2802 domain-containing protein [Motiliproteus sp. MSK22-1]|uniref:DUF2802 domain-containing protein n=1 Tax=Motiliproteus sp. MSK22-1 TaxID=1897630 RepID=UPI000977DAEE|nr:DUF2802 domain-containing protein [Motiliproteus sp. MSK22-1]OMH30060.1 hypothetical protein BGP75_19205 [Motiliproteus sp. MSK22-1]
MMSPGLFWVLLAGVAVIAIVALLIAVNVYRRLQASEEKYYALVNVIRNEIKVMNSGSIGVGRRLKQVESRLNITVEKQQELENRDPGALAYNQAAKLMEMGADVDDLVSSCGIARPEAELMALLHREIKTSPALESGR